MPVPSRLYVGWRSRAARMDLLPEPKAPGHYKDPAVIKKYVDKAREEQNKNARYLPGVASLTHLVILDATGEEYQRYENECCGQVAQNFLHFLSDQYHHRPRMTLETLGGMDARAFRPWLLSPHVRTLLRIAAYEHLASKAPSVAMSGPLSYDILIQGPIWAADPVRLLCPDEVTQKLPAPTILGLWFEDRGVPAFTDDAYGDALCCFHLCKLANI